MSNELSAVSPLAAYIGSFMNSGLDLPDWALILLASVVHWFFFLLPPVVLISYLDRKIGADIQMRIGPNRSSPFGLVQGFVDAIKMLFKEEPQSNTQERLLFKWGVVMATVCLIPAISSIPMGESWVLTSLDSGVAWILLELLFSNLCIFWAAYSCESPWTVISAFRVFSMVSAYAVPAALALIPPVLIAGSLNLERIVNVQGGMPWQWLLFHDPGAFASGILLFLALHMWQGRMPFDHARAESEIRGGFALEYGGMRKGILTFLEYASLFLASALVVSTYCGGWRTPFALESFGRAANIVEWIYFMMKVLGLSFLSIWIHWSLPRMRIDQMINVSWRVLVPLGFLGAFITSIGLVLFAGKAPGGIS